MPGLEANDDSLRKSFPSSTNDGMLSVLIRIASHNIQYHDEAKTFPKMFVFSSNQKNFMVT